MEYIVPVVILGAAGVGVLIYAGATSAGWELWAAGAVLLAISVIALLVLMLPAIFHFGFG